MEKNKGFSLIELLVVIAIIGILASVVLVNLSKQRIRAHEAASLEIIKNAMPLAIECRLAGLELNITGTASALNTYICGTSGARWPSRLSGNCQFGVISSGMAVLWSCGTGAVYRCSFATGACL